MVGGNRDRMRRGPARWWAIPRRAHWGSVHRLVAVTAVVTVVLGGTMAPSPAAAAGANSQIPFSAEPYTAAGAQQRALFSYELLPGHQILDQVAIANRSSAPQFFIVYPEDATNVPGTGGFAYETRDKMHNTTVGLWLTVGNTAISVPAGHEVVDTFQLSIPANAPPGDHVGGVVVEQVHNPAQQTSPTGLNLELRIAVPVYVRVVGKAFPSLTIEQLSVIHQSPAIPYLSGSAKVAVRLELVNTGNVILDPKTLTVSITGLLLGTIHTYTVHQTGAAQSRANPLPIQMLPGGTLTVTELWRGLPPFFPLTAHVSARAVDPNTDLSTSASASNLFWYFPWILALIVLALVAAVIVILRRRKAARGGSAGEQTPPQKSAGRALEEAEV
jgi:hypothetical protein